MPLGEKKPQDVHQPGKPGTGRNMMKVENQGDVIDMETGEVLKEETELWHNDPGEFINSYNFLYWVFVGGHRAYNDPKFRLQPDTWQDIEYAVALRNGNETGDLDLALTRVLNSSLTLVSSRAARRHVDPELVALEDMEQDYIPISLEVEQDAPKVLQWIKDRKHRYRGYRR